jgi:hypothetical protein
MLATATKVAMDWGGCRGDDDMEALANGFSAERERAGAAASQTEGGGQGHAQHGRTRWWDSACQNDSKVDGDGWQLGSGSSRHPAHGGDGNRFGERRAQLGRPEMTAAVDLGRHHHRRRRRQLGGALPLWFVMLDVDGPARIERRG